MKEHKYRALYQGEFVYFTLDDLMDINSESMSDEDYKIYHHKRNTRQQYTGIEDKNGTEIYEGDIVEWAEKGNFITGNIQKIKFTNYMIFPLAASTGDCWRVIGNVYENHELLAKGAE